MKLDPVFYVKENKLYKIADNSEVSFDSLEKIEIKWSTVEIEEEQYNEEYLAQLRDQLKSFEAVGKFAVLIPVVDKALDSAEQIELYINAYNHTARRVKDCESVAGIEFPAEYLKKGDQAITDFTETLGKKHAQYVYFAKADETQNINDKSVLNNTYLY